MVSTCCPYSPVLQEERLALHKLGIHMRAVVILDEDGSDADMMRFKNNEKPSWSSLISLVHVLPYISGNPHREPSTGALVGGEGHVSQWCQRVVLIHLYCRRRGLLCISLGST